jgi:hypothetical protein
VRIRFVAGAIALAALGLSTAACQSSVSGQGIADSGQQQANGADTSVAPTTSTTPPPSGSTIHVGALALVVPEEWTYTPSTPDHEHDGCLSDAQNACLARLTDLSPALASPDAEINLPSTTRQYGWYTGTDVPLCPAAGTDPGSQAWGGHVISSGTAPVGPHTAVYATFQVQCQLEAQDNVIRMWWLPTSKVLIDEYNSSPAQDQKFDAMLRTATFP